MEPIVVLFIIFVSVGFILYTWLSSRHRERMTMIDKGVSPADFKSGSLGDFLKPNPLSSLKWGLLAMFVGVGALVANWLDRTLYMGDSVYPASMLLFGGFGLILFYFIASRKLKSDD